MVKKELSLGETTFIKKITIIKQMVACCSHTSWQTRPFFLWRSWVFFWLGSLIFFCLGRIHNWCCTSRREGVSSFVTLRKNLLLKQPFEHERGRRVVRKSQIPKLLWCPIFFIFYKKTCLASHKRLESLILGGTYQGKPCI